MPAKIGFLFIFGCLWCGPLQSHAQDPINEKDLSQAVVSQVQPVDDQARLFSRGFRDQLNQSLRSYWQNGAGPAQIRVVTMAGGRGQSIEEISIRLVERLQLGDRAKDNGLLLLILPDARRVRIEVGQGLEGEITDAFTSQVIRETITPFFRMQRYEQGVEQALARIIQKISPTQDPQQLGFSPSERPGNDSGLGSQTINLLNLFGVPGLMFTFMLLQMFLPRRMRRHLGWFPIGGGPMGGFGGRGGFGGGFGGGGGGFSGGGSSGSW